MRTLTLSLGAWISLGACAAPHMPGAAGPIAPRPVIYGDGVPDPAEVKCAALGGRAALLAEPRGPIALCRLERALIDDWTLFWAATNHEANTAAVVFLRHRPVAPSSLAGDPAAAYCAAVGGRMLRLRDEAGQQGGVCRFDDGSLIEAQTLWRGPEEEGNRKLAALLR